MKINWSIPLILTILIFIKPLNAKSMMYSHLSSQFNIEVAIRVNTTNNPDFDSTYLRIRITEKGSGNILQTIRKQHYWLWSDFYTNVKNSRSYSTNFNTDKTVVDDDFGDVVVADLNFDGRDDFAITYNHGADNGNHYYFYFQRPDNTFYRQVYLTDKMVHFPSIIDPINQQLITRTAAGACCVGETVFQYNKAKNSWFLLSRRILE